MLVVVENVESRAVPDVICRGRFGRTRRRTRGEGGREGWQGVVRGVGVVIRVVVVVVDGCSGGGGGRWPVIAGGDVLDGGAGPASFGGIGVEGILHRGLKR